MTDRCKSVYPPPPPILKKTTCHCVIVILYTKYELSILYSCENMFDETSGEKEKKDIQGRMNRRMQVLDPTMQQIIAKLHTKY